MRVLRLLAVPVVLAAVRPVDAGVIVVSLQPGPGVDYTVLESALTVATAGDIVLVRPGVYTPMLFGSGFHVKAGVALVGDVGGEVRLQDRISIAAVPAAGFALVSGMNAEWLTHQGSQGLVLVDRSRLREGASVTGAASFVMHGSHLDGSEGVYIGHTFPGGPGLEVSSSNVRIYECFLKGGQAGGDEVYGIYWGGAGLLLYSGSVVAHATAFHGGKGADGFCTFSGPYPCYGGGIGGDGIDMPSGSVAWIGCTATAGPGGDALTSYCGTCPAGPSGLPIYPPGAAASTLPGHACGLIAPRVLREGQSASFGVKGTQGDLALLAVGTGPVDIALGALGVLHLASPTLVVLQTIPTTEVSQTFTLAELGPGVEGALAWMQAATIDPQGTVALGPLAATLLLDASL
ncbi:MAG: hypothetical protein EPO68_10365 [Planctomycetota bacterium]|nr:MAG: hypothetical protein EPO68_10365 [Planctomycetota bacterium]